ncbi:aminotransferase class I/II-fold pyridoxal phosphate-dependent enzyme [Wenyingzhuangia sp. IMCC45574]
MYNIPKSLQQKLQDRIESNSLRSLELKSTQIDFYSNDYLGFASSNIIANKALDYVKESIISNGSTGSRLISGTHSLHLEVEEQLAEFHNAEVGLLYNSGYDANVGLFSAVLQKNDVLLFDELIHASVRDGIRMSNASTYKFKHNDLEDLEKKLKRFSEKSTELYVAIETVYSMDGDTAPLKEIVDLCEQYKAHLIIDEAHSGGVFGEKGKGLANELDLESKIFARVHTFGKALGCHGAIVLGPTGLREYLINFSRSFIYTTAIPLHAVATIKAAYQELAEGESQLNLKTKITYFKQQLKTLDLEDRFIESNSAIHCSIVPGNYAVKSLAAKIQSTGISVKAVMSPTVPKGKERLRICLHAFNTEEEIDKLLQLIKEKS